MWNYFNMAKKVALSHDDNRGFFLGAIGIRKDGAIVKSCNGPVILFDERKKTSYPAAHAESRLARKLDKGSIVFVCRIRRVDGSFGIARPCPDCQRKLAAKGVKRVYYTIANNEFGTLYLGKNWKYTDIELACNY